MVKFFKTQLWMMIFWTIMTSGFYLIWYNLHTAGLLKKAGGYLPNPIIYFVSTIACVILVNHFGHSYSQISLVTSVAIQLAWLIFAYLYTQAYCKIILHKKELTYSIGYFLLIQFFLFLPTAIDLAIKYGWSAQYADFLLILEKHPFIYFILEIFYCLSILYLFLQRGFNRYVDQQELLAKNS